MVMLGSGVLKSGLNTGKIALEIVAGYFRLFTLVDHSSGTVNYALVTIVNLGNLNRGPERIETLEVLAKHNLLGNLELIAT